jgi:hypothetical protein
VSVTSTLFQFVGRLAIDKPFSNPYRGTLITSANKAERGLSALLWAGIGLIVLMTCLNMKTLFSDVALNTDLRPPPPRIAINIAGEQAKPEITLKTNNNDSLFQLAKQVIPASPPFAEAENINKQPKKAVNKTRLWQLHFQRPTISETVTNNEVADAARQLQSGDVSLAQRTLLAVLMQDPHNVEAMEGMHLVARQLGDAESEQKYLEMLRLEIPDYDFDRAGSVIGELD